MSSFLKWMLPVVVLRHYCDPSLVPAYNVHHINRITVHIGMFDVPVVRVVHKSEVVWHIELVSVILGARSFHMLHVF